MRGNLIALSAKLKSFALNGVFEKPFAGQAKGYVSLPIHKQKGWKLLPQSFVSNL